MSDNKVITKDMAVQWAMDWDPECPGDILYDAIDKCTHISDEAAEIFGDYEFKYGGKSFAKTARVFLQVTELSESAAVHLSRCRGRVVFGDLNGGLCKLSDEAAKQLAAIKKGRLEFDRVGILPPSATKILRAAGHKC